MKRLTVLILVGLLVVCPSVSFAAGTVTASPTKISVNGQTQRVVLTLTCTADASAATYPTFSIAPATYGISGWYLYSVETNPGSTAPTDNYDITIVDADGVDVAGGLLVNRDATTSELVYFSAVGYPNITGTWTWTMAGNSVNSAAVVAKLTFTAN